MVAENHKPVLIVIAGPNGSGKTTITSKILRHEWMEDAVYVNPDQVAQDKFGDWNSKEAVMQAVQIFPNGRWRYSIDNGSAHSFQKQWFRDYHRAVVLKHPRTEIQQ